MPQAEASLNETVLNGRFTEVENTQLAFNTISPHLDTPLVELGLAYLLEDALR